MHDSTQALRGKKLLLVGFTLFSMFFGAGNLIFPPFLGAQAGTALWLAFVGFAVSAIGLPIAGVAAVARAGGLPALAGRVHPRFAQVFAVLVYLSIGPCLAIPRTASTSFEMLTPLVGRSTPGQFIYSLVFFAAAYFVALKPEKLTQRLGRILCPALLVLIVVLFAGCILRPAAPGYGTPAEAYAALPAAQGVLDGYQTMDALAALNFGAVIALNLQAVGITEESAVRRGTIRAGFIAGGMLLVVYAMLGHAGAETGTVYPGLATGAEVLTALAQTLFGRAGLVLIAAIFVIACFNTCVGLIACVEAQTLTACFELFAEGTLAEGATLTLNTAPLACRCENCGHAFSLTQRRFVCPACGSENIHFNGGHGLTLQSLRVESEETDHA